MRSPVLAKFGATIIDTVLKSIRTVIWGALGYIKMQQKYHIVFITGKQIWNAAQWHMHKVCVASPFPLINHSGTEDANCWSLEIGICVNYWWIHDFSRSPVICLSSSWCVETDATPYHTFSARGQIWTISNEEHALCPWCYVSCVE